VTGRGRIGSPSDLGRHVGRQRFGPGLGPWGPSVARRSDRLVVGPLPLPVSPHPLAHGRWGRCRRNRRLLSSSSARGNRPSTSAGYVSPGSSTRGQCGEIVVASAATTL
jgi:hypothetical protein